MTTPPTPPRMQPRGPGGQPQVTNTTTAAGAPLGVAANEKGVTGYAAQLAQAHAAVVSEFVKRGHVAAMEAHAAP